MSSLSLNVVPQGDRIHIKSAAGEFLYNAATKSEADQVAAVAKMAAEVWATGKRQAAAGVHVSFADVAQALNLDPREDPASLRTQAGFLDVQAAVDVAQTLIALAEEYATEQQAEYDATWS